MLILYEILYDWTNFQESQKGRRVKFRYDSISYITP